MVKLMANSKRVYAKGDLPVPLSMRWAPATPHLHRRASNTSRWFWFSLLGVTASLLWVLVHAKFYLCPPRPASLFSASSLEGLLSNPAGPHRQFPGDSQSFCQIPRLGSLTWGSEPSQQCKNFFGVIVPSLWVLPAGMGFDFVAIAPSYCLAGASSLSLDVGYLFLVGSSVLLSAVLLVQQLVAILGLSQEELSTQPFTLPSWSPSRWF